MDVDQLSMNGDSKDEDYKEENDDGESRKNSEAGKITFRNAPEFRRDFITYCLEEVNYSRSIGSTLKIPSWEKVGVKLSEKYGYPMKSKKLRNHWDYLKKQYVSWSTLLSLLGHGNDEATTDFNCSREQWDDISKKVKNANHFKEKGLEDADLLKCLFGDIDWATAQPYRTRNANVQPLAVASAAPLDTSTQEDSEQPARINDQEPSASGEDTMETSNSQDQDLMKQKKRRKTEASSSDTVKGKGVTLMERQQIVLEKQEIVLKKLQNILEKQQSAKEKKESLPVDFLKTLDSLKDAGHISDEDALEVVFKVSELSGWQQLFVNLPTTERQVSYVNKLLGKQ